MSNNQQKRRYKPEERKAALTLSKKVGPAEAARQLGIPEGTVTMWRYLAKKSDAQKPAASPAVAPLVEPKPERAKTANVAKSYKPSLRAQVLEYAAESGVTAAASKFA